MSSPDPSFIYTHFFTASHIIITEEEPVIVLPGLYVDPLTEQAEDITLYCSFSQLNDILYCDGDGPDEVLEQLADNITAEAQMPLTLDVTETGGLECSCMWYCMERIAGDDAKESNREGDYMLRGFIKRKETAISNKLVLEGDKSGLLNRYLLLLAMQYDFYLYFSGEKMPDETALYYAGLQERVVFDLAKLVAEIMKAG